MLSKQLLSLPSRRFKIRLVLAILGFGQFIQAAEIISADLCIYGGTAGGVAAAVQATRMGRSAVIAEFGQHLGGMTSGGLGATDIGNIQRTIAAITINISPRAL